MKWPAWQRAIWLSCDIFIVVCYLASIVMVMILKKRRKVKIQHMLWLNLSAYVVLLNFIYIGELLLAYGNWDSDSVSLTSSTAQVVLICYMVLAMISINIDRLLLIILNIKYPLYVTKTRVNCMILTTWVSCLFTFLCILLTNGDPAKLADRLDQVIGNHIVLLLDR